jgi:chitodextrinase
VWVTDITHNSANINWETNEKSDSQVEDWSSPSLLTTLDPTLVTIHRVHLANLSLETTYHFKVMSRDKAGNRAVSDEYTFTTLAAPPAPDTTPPAISDVSATGITTNSATIRWKTDEKSDSQVEYWSSPHAVTPLDPAMVTSHEVQLSNLIPATTYHYKVKSSDASGNLAVSDEYTFTTLTPAVPPTPPAPPKPTNWWFIGGIIAAGVVIGGLLAYFLWWRRRVV